MKIKVRAESIENAMARKPYANKKPRIQMLLLKKLVEILGNKDLKATSFTCEKINMERLGHEPCLIFMNHSSFIDLEMAFILLKKRRFSIVATDDSFIGKEWLLRRLGCISTKKFMQDTQLVRNILFSINVLHQSVLMYPEASYTFDGTETPLPKAIGKYIKLCKIPVVIIKTDCGNFLRDPLYNNLQIRDVKTHAVMEYVLSKEDIEAKSTGEIQEILDEKLSYNHFLEQKERNILIKEDFRADYLNRILYKCPSCGMEGNTEGKGITLTCKSCGRTTTLNENGTLSGERFSLIPEWYSWEREMVRKEIEEGTYHILEDVEIYIFRSFRTLSHVGVGTLDINRERYSLSMKGKEIFSLSTKEQYSLYSDYYWYELGDMICIGDAKTRYYCIIRGKRDVVAKARLAQEEIYRLRTKKQ